MVYVVYGASGAVEGAYGSTAVVPAGKSYIAVEAATWEKALKGTNRRVVDGQLVWDPVAVEKAALMQYTYEQKCAVAYGGVTVVKDEVEYLFETSTDSITMCNAQTNAFIVDETLTSVDWKVYLNGTPVLLTLTKAQFAQILSFGMQMINSAFAVEGDLNGEVAEMTEAQRKDETYIANFKARVQSSFGQIPRRFVITAEAVN